MQVVADRTMTWDQTGYGSHAERGILTRTATKWYFAEGATFWQLQPVLPDPEPERRRRRR